MISSEEIPFRYVPVVERCECPSWRWISGSGIRLVQQLDGMRMAKLVGREAPPDARLKRDLV